MIRPLFIVTENKLVKRRDPANAYTDAKNTQEMWRVKMTHSYYAGIGMELYFETEPMATPFSLWTLIDPYDFEDYLGSEKFIGRNITKIKRWIPNFYTGLTEPIPFWMVDLDGDRGTMIRQYYRMESHAMNMMRGTGLTARSLMTLMPAIPADIVDAIAEKIRQAEEEARNNPTTPPTNPGMNNPPPAPDPGVPRPSNPFEGAVFDLLYCVNGGSGGWVSAGNPTNTSLGAYWVYSEHTAWRYYGVGQLRRNDVNRIGWNNTGNLAPGSTVTSPSGQSAVAGSDPDTNFVFYGYYVNLPASAGAP